MLTATNPPHAWGSIHTWKWPPSRDSSTKLWFEHSVAMQGTNWGGSEGEWRLKLTKSQRTTLYGSPHLPTYVIIAHTHY